MTKPRVFSGIQPSGSLTLGNYLGALKQWLADQKTKQSIFCVVDLHALTIPQDPKILKEKIQEVAALYLAAGLDPQKSLIFVQSQNPDHAQLAWILNCFLSMGELSRMTQFKEKSQKQKKFVSVGLFDYPALMAADILLYQTDEVPVGEDQKQHVELTRDVAQRFNNQYGPIFKLPKVKLPLTGARIKNLQNPNLKMSKSDSKPLGSIYLLDSPAAIQAKIKKAVTDSGSEIKTDPKKPAISNLLQIFAGFSSQSLEQIEKDYQGQTYQKFKKDLTELVISVLKPLQERYAQIRQSHELEKILADGANRAQKLSAPTLAQTKSALGLQ